MNSDRNAAVIEMAAQTPAPSLAEVGEAFGVTREGVRLILIRAGVARPRHH